MKKLLALILALALVFTLSACGSGEGNDDNKEGSTDGTGNATVSLIKDPTQLLNNAWAKMEAKFTDENRFMVFGGDGGEDGMSIAENAAGSFNVANAEYLDSQTGFPQAEISKIDAAASMMHGMMQNHFTAGAYKVKDAKNTAALTTAIKDSLANKQWMCGMPEKFVVITVDEVYIVSAYGLNDNIESFKAALIEAYPNAKVVVDQAIAG